MTCLNTFWALEFRLQLPTSLAIKDTNMLHYKKDHKSVLLGGTVCELYVCLFDLWILTIGNLIKMLTNPFSYDHIKTTAH